MTIEVWHLNDQQLHQFALYVCVCRTCLPFDSSPLLTVIVFNLALMEAHVGCTHLPFDSAPLSPYAFAV